MRLAFLSRGRICPLRHGIPQGITFCNCTESWKIFLRCDGCETGTGSFPKCDNKSSPALGSREITITTGPMWAPSCHFNVADHSHSDNKFWKLKSWLKDWVFCEFFFLFCEAKLLCLVLTSERLCVQSEAATHAMQIQCTRLYCLDVHGS